MHTGRNEVAACIWKSSNGPAGNSVPSSTKVATAAATSISGQHARTGGRGSSHVVACSRPRRVRVASDGPAPVQTRMSNAERARRRVFIERAQDLVWLGIALAAFAPRRPAPLSFLRAEARRHLDVAGARLNENLVRALEANANAFVEVKPGVWDVVWNYHPEQVEKLHRQQRARSRRRAKREA